MKSLNEALREAEELLATTPETRLMEALDEVSKLEAGSLDALIAALPSDKISEYAGACERLNQALADALPDEAE